LTRKIYTAEALPGSGKTKSFIESLDPDNFNEHIVLALPTKRLTSEIKDKLEACSIPHLVINSDSTRRVSYTVQNTLEDIESLDPCVLIITHATLKQVPPEAFIDWTLIIDEVPTVANNFCKPVGLHTYESFLAPYIEVGEDSRATLKPERELEARDIYYEVVEDKGLETIYKTLEALLKPNPEVYVERKEDLKDGRLKHYIKAVDFHDFTEAFEACEEVHILGNGISKSVLYAHLVSQGFAIETSRFTPDKRTYNITPTLLPLFSGSRMSKTLMLTMPDGSVADQWVEGCVGDLAFKRVMDYVGDNGVLVQVHSWCKFPFDQYPNVTVLPFDARGINSYSSVAYTASLIHGNPDTNEDHLNSIMFEKMGMDVVEGKAALRYERYIEMLVQSLTRSPVRKFEEQEYPTYHILPTEDAARKVEEVLGIKCNYDLSLLGKRPQSKAKQGKAELVARAMRLAGGGMSHRQIAKALGKSHPTISRWLKSA
jgi:hypothetical protein